MLYRVTVSMYTPDGYKIWGRYFVFEEGSRVYSNEMLKVKYLTGLRIERLSWSGWRTLIGYKCEKRSG